MLLLRAFLLSAGRLSRDWMGMLISSLCPVAAEEARAAGAGVVILLVRGVEYPLAEELAVGAEVTESLLEILLAEEEGLPRLDWSRGGEAPAVDGVALALVSDPSSWAKPAERRVRTIAAIVHPQQGRLPRPGSGKGRRTI